MEEYPAREINAYRLAEEIGGLDLPGWKGLSILDRELDADLNVMRDKAGIILTRPRYILIKCDTLNAQQKDLLDLTIEGHVTISPEPTPEEKRLDVLTQNLADDSITLSGLKELMRLERGMR